MDPIYIKYKGLIGFIIIAGLSLVLVHYWQQMRKREEDLERQALNEETDIALDPDTNAITGDDDLLFREVVRKLMNDINDATSRAEIEAYYWDIEHVEDNFRGKVGDGLLKIYIEWLYDVHAKRRDTFNKSIQEAGRFWPSS
jgi:hypothetical protein